MHVPYTQEKGEEIAGTTGFEAIRYLSVTNSHPEFPIFATILGCLPSCANGRAIVAVCDALCYVYQSVYTQVY